MRYYDKAKQGQATKPSETTIIDSDERVANFFQPTPDGYKKAYDADGLPFNELIPLPTQAELDQQVIDDANQVEYAALAALDIASIRDIREWIAAQPDAPQALKDREALAVAARGRIV